MNAAAIVPPDWERAIAYGDGFFETILAVDGCAPLWHFHRERIQQSATRLHIQCDIAALDTAFLAQVQQTQNAVIKMIVARSGGQRGYSSTSANETTVALRSYPLPHYSRERLTQGIKLHVCRQRLAHNTVLAGIKHLNRLEQVLAASELQADVADEGLMLDVSGAVIEGISSNIFIVRGDALLTPSLHQCGVAGVMRATILQSLAQEADFTVQELRLTLADCLQADAIFCCNSIFGIAPVRAIGVSTIKNKKTVIDALWQLLAKLGYARLYD